LQLQNVKREIVNYNWNCRSS